MDKKKALIIGGGAIAAGAFLYSQKGTEGTLGTAGNIIAAPIESLIGEPDIGVAPKKDSTAFIPELMEMLPTFGEGGDMLPYTPPPDMLAGYGVPAITTPKKKFSLPSTGIFGKAIVGGARVAGATPMVPVQVLGGTAAKATTAGIKYAMGKGYPRMQRAQAARVRKYPRASHAVSMVTGGVTARAPVSKKQVAARKKYPRVYKAWKSVFKWVGA